MLAGLRARLGGWPDVEVGLACIDGVRMARGWPRWAVDVARSRRDRRRWWRAGRGWVEAGRAGGGGGENGQAWDSGRRGREHARLHTPVSPSIPFKT